jgi:hypothetical protein
MLHEHVTEDELVAFLDDAERGMGLEPVTKRNQLVTAKLVEWYGAATHD